MPIFGPVYIFNNLSASESLANLHMISFRKQPLTYSERDGNPFIGSECN